MKAGRERRCNEEATPTAGQPQRSREWPKWWQNKRLTQCVGWRAERAAGWSAADPGESTDRQQPRGFAPRTAS